MGAFGLVTGPLAFAGALALAGAAAGCVGKEDEDGWTGCMAGTQQAGEEVEDRLTMDEM